MVVPPSLGWSSSLPLGAAVLTARKGAESPLLQNWVSPCASVRSWHHYALSTIPLTCDRDLFLDPLEWARSETGELPELWRREYLFFVRVKGCAAPEGLDCHLTDPHPRISTRNPRFFDLFLRSDVWHVPHLWKTHYHMSNKNSTL